MKKKCIAIIMGSILCAVALCGCGNEEELRSLETEQSTQISAIDEVSEEAVESTVYTYEEETQDDADVVEGEQFTFSTTDIDGNAATQKDYSDAKLIMVNFWEPWCGPCVNEMPDLEKLYEEYSADGFMILGVFSTTGVDDEVREVLSSCGTTYPILRYVDSMEPYITEYVPTTIFIDGNGNVLTDEPIVGSNSYDDWKQVIEGYMN